MMETMNWNAGSYKGRIGQRVVFLDPKRLRRALDGHVQSIHDGHEDKACAACKELRTKLRQAERGKR
jgi:hypothetical protein